MYYEQCIQELGETHLLRDFLLVLQRGRESVSCMHGCCHTSAANSGDCVKRQHPGCTCAAPTRGGGHAHGPQLSLSIKPVGVVKSGESSDNLLRLLVERSPMGITCCLIMVVVFCIPAMQCHSCTSATAAAQRKCAAWRGAADIDMHLHSPQLAFVRRGTIVADWSLVVGRTNLWWLCPPLK